jgi:hypothetical protein
VYSHCGLTSNKDEPIGGELLVAKVGAVFKVVSDVILRVNAPRMSDPPKVSTHERKVRHETTRAVFHVNSLQHLVNLQEGSRDKKHTC